jgi:hypothetical protein
VFLTLYDLLTGGLTLCLHEQDEAHAAADTTANDSMAADAAGDSAVAAWLMLQVRVLYTAQRSTQDISARTTTLHRTGQHC